MNEGARNANEEMFRRAVSSNFATVINKLQRIIELLEAKQQILHAPDAGWVCGECEFTNLEIDTVCQLCTTSRPKRVI